MISYYDILGIRVHATGEEIREAYRRRVLECHPDKGGNAEEFKKVREAYETLSNPVERESYDQFLYYIRLHEFMARVNESTRTEEDVTSEEQGVQQEEMSPDCPNLARQLPGGMPTQWAWETSCTYTTA